MTEGKELFACGHRACAGCSEPIAVRMILEEAGPNTIGTICTGCLEVVSTGWPETAWEIPLIHAAVYEFEGRLMSIIPGEGPCLRCLLPSEPFEKKIVPVLGATPGVIASLQAMEVIKIITGIGESLIGRLLIFDGWNMSFEEIKVEKRTECRVCGTLDSR